MFGSKYSKVLTVILTIVIIGIVGTIAYFVYDLYMVKSKEDKAKDVVDEFDVSVRKEFDETNEEDSQGEGDPLDSIGSLEGKTKKVSGEKTYMEGYEVMGTIEIPKTKVKYPVLSEVTKKSLETSVAILYGVGLNQLGNTTIVGHNYRNGLFFSNNKKLSVGDTIKITDQSGETIDYGIYDMFETSPNDASYMQRDTAGAREISLSTCTDDSSERLIILAREQ